MEYWMGSWSLGSDSPWVGANEGEEAGVSNQTKQKVENFKDFVPEMCHIYELLQCWDYVNMAVLDYSCAEEGTRV